jgi:thiamine biosynthesis lipoprotein
VDAATGIVALADGVALDLGAIAKGWIADQVAAELASFAPALVDAGGDIACTARHDDEPWSIDVDGSDLRIELREGGIATSGTDRRRWVDPASGHEQHHLIDPRTGAPSTSDLVRVTTIARSCADAEVASTALLVAGSCYALDVAATVQDAWRAVRRDGSILASTELR